MEYVFLLLNFACTPIEVRYWVAGTIQLNYENWKSMEQTEAKTIDDINDKHKYV